MPLGSFVQKAGLMLRQRGWPILQLADGARWRLNLPEEFGQYIGQQVRVDGVESADDLIEVSRVAPERPPRRS